MLTEELIRKKIAENDGKGVWLEGISNEAYHLGPGISSSDIKTLINGSVRKWLWGKKNPKKPTKDMRLGTMIHAYLLEKNDFWNRYRKSEETPIAPPRNTTVGKDLFKEWSLLNNETLDAYKGKLESHEWQEEFVRHFHPELSEKEIVYPDEFEIIEGIEKSIMSHPDIPAMINPKNCKSEISMYWIDKETNILCKCRPDINNFAWPCILDVKSCQDASIEAFEGDVTNRDMYVSAYWYLWGSSQVFETQYDEFIYIPCEKTAPFEVEYYIADAGSIALGEGLARAGLEIIKRHLDESSQGIDSRIKRSSPPKSVGVRPYAHNKLSQVIFAHDLQRINLEKNLGV